MERLQKETVEFESDWLTVEKLQFKILTMITVLAENHLAYRGTLADMCDFFGVASRNSRTNAKIKSAVEALESANYIKVLRDGRTWTLTLSKSAERKSKVIRIRKDWVLAAKACEGNGVDWSVVLKVWLYLMDTPTEIITTASIAEAVNVPVSQVARAKNVLRTCLNAITTKVINKALPEGGYYCVGSEITLNAWIDEPSASV